MEALDAFTAFLAAGVGGPRDWSGAMQLLQRRKMEPHVARQMRVLDSMSLDAAGDPVQAYSPELLSGSPDVRLFRAFLTEAECNYLIEVAEPHLTASMVIDPGTGAFIRHPVRRSDAMAFPLMSENPVIHAINRRIALASNTSPQQGEPLQILRYQPGDEYRPHLDALPGEANQRILTFLIYLNDDYGGGATSFPQLEIDVRGRMGDALLFRNADANGVPDVRTRHAGCPVTSGVKKIASRWIRVTPLDLTGKVR